MKIISIASTAMPGSIVVEWLGRRTLNHRGSWVRIPAMARRGICEQDTLKSTAWGSQNKQNCLRHVPLTSVIKKNARVFPTYSMGKIYKRSNLMKLWKHSRNTFVVRIYIQEILPMLVNIKRICRERRKWGRRTQFVFRIRSAAKGPNHLTPGCNNRYKWCTEAIIKR
jgi:hypothetical protein